MPRHCSDLTGRRVEQRSEQDVGEVPALSIVPALPPAFWIAMLCPVTRHPHATERAPPLPHMEARRCGLPAVRLVITAE
jgi:hypothetical protein